MSKKLSQGAKASKPETVRVNLSIGADQYKRLFMHALMSNRSAGEIVTSLIESHLKEWALPARLTDRVKANDRHVAPPCVSDSAAPPALQDAA
jgi:hypothetical protein